VVGLLRNLGSHDHLRGGIDRDLRVVALHEAALVGSIRHDPALWIGEVALRRVVWPGLVRISRFRLAATLLLRVRPASARPRRVAARPFLWLPVPKPLWPRRS